MVTMLVFLFYFVFLWLKLKDENIYINLTFLFQIITIGFFHFKDREVLIFLILLFSIFSTSMYFIIHRLYRIKNSRLKDQIKKASNSGGIEIINSIINVKHFGYINCNTKKFIINTQLIIIILCLGDL